MKKNTVAISVALAVAIGSIATVPLANAAANDSTVFN